MPDIAEVNKINEQVSKHFSILEYLPISSKKFEKLIWGSKNEIIFEQQLFTHRF